MNSSSDSLSAISALMGFGWQATCSVRRRVSPEALQETVAGVPSVANIAALANESPAVVVIVVLRNVGAYPTLRCGSRQFGRTKWQV